MRRYAQPGDPLSEASLASGGRVVTGPTRAGRAAGILLLLALALILAACGSGSDDAASSSAPTVTSVSDAEPPTVSDAGSQEVADDPGGDADESVPIGLGEKRSIVVIGDEQFEFDMSPACLSMGGAVGGTGFTADGSVSLEIDISPEDWETSADGWEAPSIRIRDQRDESIERDWETGGSNIDNYEELRELVRVDSFSVVGARASGTATFIDLQAYMFAGALGDPLPDPVAGTFDINCG